MHLAHFYSQLLFGPTLDRVPISQGVWVSMETFDMINSFRQRRAMLIGAARRRGFDHDTIKAFNKQLVRLQGACDRRIVAAHGRWAISDDEPTGLVWTRTIGSTDAALVYEPADFEAALQEIVVASQESYFFFHADLLPKLKTDAQALIAQIRAGKDSPDADVP